MIMAHWLKRMNHFFVNVREKIGSGRDNKESQASLI